MKLKSLLFGSAAGLMVVTGAQAADLPAAEPVEYVRVCDAFGTGFFYIPGTDTCLKIDGYARYEMHWVDDEDNDKNFNNFTTRARGEVRFDARTMTDLGLLRSYVALRGTIGPTNSGGYSDGFNVDKAWLSLANDSGTLTAGHHGSFYDFFGGSAMNTRIGGDDPTTSTNTLAYTFAVGNGVSASVAVEDKWFRRYGVGYTGTTVTTSVSNSSVEFGHTITYFTANEGQEVPDFVANIRVDQGWGSAQIMGAVGRVGIDESPVTDREWGYAVGGGLSLGLPGTGISFDMQADYARGLVAYATTGNGAPIFDAWDNGNGHISLTKAWAIKAALGADLSSNVSVALNGAYADVDHGGWASSVDYDTWIAAGTINWKPTSGLTVSGELAYERVGNYNVYDPNIDDYDKVQKEDVWGAMMRINRTF